MLSYRHAFHAGNHADVLKHYVLAELLTYMNQKDKPYWYIDTHAGAGRYTLDSGYAAKNGEYVDGIGRLYKRGDLPAGLERYVDLVGALNETAKLTAYPGSPYIAAQLLRRDDKMRLFELHSSDQPLLEQCMAETGHRALIQQADGFAGLKSVLPPPPRRAVTLIDPPYEDKRDYDHVVNACADALKRFATGVYMVWYPLLQRPEAVQLPARLKALPIDRWLHIALTVRRPSIDGFGMHGSGLFIINPPWSLHDALAATMPYLKTWLAVDAGAHYQLEQKTV